MTTTPTRLERPEIRRTSLLTQSLAITRRNLIHIKRMPEMLMDVTIQPVMFVVLFAFVFGGSIAVDGADAGYNEWLMAGIMGQTIAFASFIVAIGLTADIDKGIVDRMRSLPIHTGAVLVGRSISSLIHSSIGIFVMSITGLVIGWRIRGSVVDAVVAYVLLLLWGFAMIWVGILVGSALKSVEAVQGVMFTAIFPLTFLANTFAPTENMPGVLRAIAEWNPDLVAGPGRPSAAERRPGARRRRLAAPAPDHRDPGVDGRDHRGDGTPVAARLQAAYRRLRTAPR